MVTVSGFHHFHVADLAVFVKQPIFHGLDHVAGANVAVECLGILVVVVLFRQRFKGFLRLFAGQKFLHQRFGLGLGFLIGLLLFRIGAARRKLSENVAKFHRLGGFGVSRLYDVEHLRGEGFCGGGGRRCGLFLGLVFVLFVVLLFVAVEDLCVADLTGFVEHPDHFILGIGIRGSLLENAVIRLFHGGKHGVADRVDGAVEGGVSALFKIVGGFVVQDGIQNQLADGFLSLGQLLFVGDVGILQRGLVAALELFDGAGVGRIVLILKPEVDHKGTEFFLGLAGGQLFGIFLCLGHVGLILLLFLLGRLIALLCELGVEGDLQVVGLEVIALMIVIVAVHIGVGDCIFDAFILLIVEFGGKCAVFQHGADVALFHAVAISGGEVGRGGGVAGLGGGLVQLLDCVLDFLLFLLVQRHAGRLSRFQKG